MKRLIQLISITSLIAFSALHAEVDSAESSPESSTSVESNSAESKGFCAGAHSNTGCFVGVSVGFSPATTRLDLVNSNAIITQQPKKDGFTFPISLDIGYQWYYAQNAGFRFKAYLGYENFSAKDMTASAIFNGAVSPTTFSLISHALTYGLDARYLYDFIYGGEHTFGANIGFGVEGSSFFNTIVMPYGDPGLGQTRDVAYPNYTKFTWTSGVGLHYFYKSHHQILLSYIYRGYTDKLQDRVAINEILKGSASSFANHTIQLSYAYKF